MASFAEFYSTFDGDTNRRGKQFERFVKWFLKNDPEWATQVQDVWLWDEYPTATRPTMVIALANGSVTREGELWTRWSLTVGSD
jgi:predicted helicase